MNELKIMFEKIIKYLFVEFCIFALEIVMELLGMEEFRKAQAEVEKKNEKPMSQKMFKAI